MSRRGHTTRRSLWLQRLLLPPPRPPGVAEVLDGEPHPEGRDAAAKGEEAATGHDELHTRGTYIRRPAHIHFVVPESARVPSDTKAVKLVRGGQTQDAFNVGRATPRSIYRIHFPRGPHSRPSVRSALVSLSSSAEVTPIPSYMGYGKPPRLAKATANLSIVSRVTPSGPPRDLSGDGQLPPKFLHPPHPNRHHGQIRCFFVRIVTPHFCFLPDVPLHQEEMSSGALPKAARYASARHAMGHAGNVLPSGRPANVTPEAAGRSRPER